MPGIFDVSMFLSENTPVYPGDPELKIEKVKTISKDGYELSKLSMGVHTGTHIDAPAHLFSDKTNVNELDLKILIGKTIVLEFPNTDYISATDLKSLDFSNYSRVLFKTNNSGWGGRWSNF